MIFWKLGFRNLLRNKKRTILAGMAVGLGLAAMILMDGFWLGMLDNMVKSVTTTYIGHAQIHHEKFKATNESDFFINNSEKVLKAIKKNKNITAVSPRVLSIGMISSSQNSMNVQLIGINPKQEKKVSKFHARLIKGDFLKTDDDIVIGERLRKKLDVELGDRLVITVSETGSGDIKQELFRLSGVYGIGSKDLDEGVVLVQQEKLQKILQINEVHEIVIMFKDFLNKKENLVFLTSLKQDDLIVETWEELTPQVVAMFEMSDMSFGILGMILFSLVALGILNTMFMSLFERSYEFGVIQAIGTRKKEIILIILSESFTLALISIFIGIVMAAGIGTLLMIYGVDYSGIEFGEITFTEKIYFIFSVKQFTIYPLITLVFTVMISLYPAWSVIRRNPAQALHRSL
jgi:ABC-type lipoprotein release transport system permease subunit